MYFGFNVAGAGSTPLHYAACGGNVVCFQVCPAQKFVSSQIRDGQSKLTGWCVLCPIAGMLRKQKLRHAWKGFSKSRSRSMLESNSLWVFLFDMCKYNLFFFCEEWQPACSWWHRWHMKQVEWACKMKFFDPNELTSFVIRSCQRLSIIFKFVYLCSCIIDICVFL